MTRKPIFNGKGGANVPKRVVNPELKRRDSVYQPIVTIPRTNKIAWDCQFNNCVVF